MRLAHQGLDDGRLADGCITDQDTLAPVDASHDSGERRKRLTRRDEKKKKGDADDVD